ncbi:MAG: phage tail protein, partial [Candidatus Angelobacter sp.]
MSATIADLKASISISGADKAKSDLGGIGKSVGSMGDSFKHGLATVTGFITGFAGLTIVSDAIGLVKDQLVGMFQAAIDEQKIMGQLNAAIKSTHDVSGMTADSLKALADKIEGFSGIDDAAVKSGEAMLLTFTNIGKNVFPDVTQAVADMATAMNGGAIPTADQMRATALQVGKALNDPINGMATLQRVGVKLSETQKDQVKHFMAIGDTADAQKVILGELNKEFGGSAKAAGETLPGQLARLQNSLQDTGKGILSGLMPTLSDLLENHILPLADQFGKWLPGAIKQAQTSLTDLWKQIGPIAIDVKDFAVNAWGKLQAAFKDPATQKQMGNFGDIVGKMSDAFQKAWPSIKQFAETTGKDLLDAMKAAWPKIEEGRKAFADFTTDVINRIGPIVKEWWPKIKTGLEALQKVWNTAWPTMQQTLGMAWGVIQGVVQVGWNIISGIIKVGMDILSGNWGKAWDDLKSALSGVWQGMQQIAKSLFQKLHDTIMEKLGELHDNATAKANDLKNSIVSTIQA